MLPGCNSSSSINEIHSICPGREREITQLTKRQDTQQTETLAGKIEIQNRENEPTKSKWGWSDLNDLTPKPSQHKKVTSRERNDNYDRLWTSTKPQRNKSTCRKFTGNTWRRDKVKPRLETLEAGMIRYGWVLGGKTTKTQWNAQARNPCNDKIEALSQVCSKP